MHTLTDLTSDDAAVSAPASSRIDAVDAALSSCMVSLCLRHDDKPIRVVFRAVGLARAQLRLAGGDPDNAADLYPRAEALLLVKCRADAHGDADDSENTTAESVAA